MKKMLFLLLFSLLLTGCVYTPPTETAVPTETAAPSASPAASTAPATEPVTQPPATEPLPTEPEVDAALLVGSATADMALPSYWGGSTELVMDDAAIEAYNARLCATEGTGLCDLLQYPETLSGSDIRALIEQYTVSKALLDGQSITDEQLQALQAQRNLAALAETVNLGYGLITAPADLRSFPTDSVSSSGDVLSGSQCFDDFQQTQLRLGEGVLILHSSLDGAWLFVQAQNYCGWVETRYVALCSRQEMEDYLTAEQFGVILERKTLTVDGAEMTLSMGTRLAMDESGSFLLPQRQEDGTLTLQKCDLEIDYSVGYLPYTTENLYRQALRLLGTPYSWGSKEGYDCSDTLVAIYACFGIHLPRNSSAMALVGQTEWDFSALAPGALLVMKGHVMLYLGSVDGEIYVLQNFTRCTDAGGQSRSVYAAALSSISDIFLSSGKSYQEGIIAVTQVQ